MSSLFLRPAILGATPLGGMMAALFAEAGLPVALYDRPHDDENRPNDWAQSCLRRLLSHHPLPILPTEALAWIAARNYRDHWQALQQHDLVLDCSEDHLAGKRALWMRLSPALRRDVVRVSFSHDLDAQELVAAQPAGHRTRFALIRPALPFRRPRLLELVASERTEPRVMQQLRQFFSQELGREVIEIPDGEQALHARLLLFTLGSVCHHSERLGLSLAQIPDLSALLGRSEASVVSLAADIGIETLQRWQKRLSSAEKNHFSGLWRLPKSFPERIQRLPISEALQKQVQQGQWQKILNDHSLPAQFIVAHLQDTQQYLQFLQQQGFTREQLESVMLHGLGWEESAFTQLRRFSPTVMNRHPLPAPYPLLPLRGKRFVVPKNEAHPFLQAGELLWRRDLSELCLYRQRALIWQPRQHRAVLNLPLLQDLAAAVEWAREKRFPLMIYQHGDWGQPRNWRAQPEQWAEERDALYDLLVQLRLLPRPVLAAISGQVYDYGSALLMQCDYGLYAADGRWHCASLDEDLPPVGGLWFEWLRRLPWLDESAHHAQIHASLKRLLSHKSMSLISARSMGLIRLGDRLLTLPQQLPQQALQLLDHYLEGHCGGRQPRYGQLALSPRALLQLQERALESPHPDLYRAMVDLLRAQDDSHSLSLSVFLRREGELFQRLLAC